MKKEEIAALMLRLFGTYDQAGIQDNVYEMMAAAPIKLQKQLIYDMLQGGRWDSDMGLPDEEDLILARKISGFDGEVSE